MGRIRFMQLGRSFAHSLEWIKYGWQYLVIDLDHAERFFSNRGCFCRDKGDPVTNVTHAAIEQVSIIGRCFWVRLTRGAVRYAW